MDIRALACLVILVTVELAVTLALVYRGIQVTAEFLDIVDILVFRVIRDTRVLAFRDILVILEFQVTQDIVASQDHLVTQDTQASQVTLDHLVTQAIQASQDHQVTQDTLE